MKAAHIEIITYLLAAALLLFWLERDNREPTQQSIEDMRLEELSDCDFLVSPPDEELKLLNQRHKL